MIKRARSSRTANIALVVGLAACSQQAVSHILPDAAPVGGFGERVRVLELYPGVTATMVMPPALASGKRLDLILYALPNGNSTAQTIGRTLSPGVDWHFDIQHIGAQTRALRARGFAQAVVVYLEADTKSWPEWRRTRGVGKANARIVAIVDQLRATVGNPSRVVVTLTGHSGGGSFIFGFIEGQDSLPPWLERIAFLDANYNFEAKHGDKIAAWLRGDRRHTLVTLAYDDREIILDGKKIVADSGGTWRASQRMLDYLKPHFTLAADTLGDFLHFHDTQIEILLHPNPRNRILHTEMIGEMNGYMHALLVRRPEYERGAPVLKPTRAYTRWIESDVTLPQPAPPSIPARAPDAPTGSAFIASVATLLREEREGAIRRALLDGNIPLYLRTLRTVVVSGTGADGAKHTIAYDVMPDYLAIGSDEDFVRMPMNPYTAQAFGDAFGFVLPTRKMVNDIWTAAAVHVDPQPLTQERESPLTFLQHHRIIEDQLRGVKRGTLVAGIKKDVVVTNRLTERENRVAIFGWHYASGQPIQPLYVGHVDWYVDYSHGIRPVHRTMRVDGVPRSFESILGDPALQDLLSDEGELVVTRYER